MLPFSHDILTVRGEGARDWVPELGIEKMLTNDDGKVLGYSSYRTFLLMFSFHLMGLLTFLWWYYDAHGKSYRPAIMVGILLSGFQVFIILFDKRNTPLNEVDIKLYITVISVIVLGLNYFFSKVDPYEEKSSN